MPTTLQYTTAANPLAAVTAAKTAPDGHCVLSWPGGSITLPATSPETEYKPGGVVWGEAARTQDYTLMRPTGMRREAIPLTAQLTGYRGVGVDRQITLLRQAQSQTSPVTVAWTRQVAAHKWLMTDLSIRIERMNPGDNAIRHAVATITLVEWRDEQLTVPSATKTPAATRKTAKKYTVKRGDTLTGIASKVCKDASHFARIATDNKLKSGAALKPGQVLTIRC